VSRYPRLRWRNLFTHDILFSALRTFRGGDTPFLRARGLHLEASLFGNFLRILVLRETKRTSLNICCMESSRGREKQRETRLAWNWSVVIEGSLHMYSKNLGIYIYVHTLRTHPFHHIFHPGFLSTCSTQNGKRQRVCLEESLFKIASPQLSFPRSGIT
jgi:hypothetical protein